MEFIKQQWGPNGEIGMYAIFFKTVFVYAVSCDLFMSAPRASKAAFKCMPVLLLAAIMVVRCKDKNLPPGPRSYSLRMTISFLMAAAGDAALVWDLTEFGLLLFGSAHMWTIYALGFTPLKWHLGSVFITFVVAVLSQMNLPEHLLFMVSIYALLLGTLLWRAFARFPAQGSAYGIFGAILFTISDSLLGYSMFNGMPYSHLLVMGTYYAAQLFLACSASTYGGRFHVVHAD